MSGRSSLFSFTFLLCAVLAVLFALDAVYVANGWEQALKVAGFAAAAVYWRRIEQGRRKGLGL